MSLPRRPSLVAAAVVIYCGWQSLSLIEAWRHAPFDRLGWVAFLIWLAPLAVLWFRPGDAMRIAGANPVLLWLGLSLSVVGMLGEINVLCHAGFACALAGTIGWSWNFAFWLLSAVSWMPVFGYFVSSLAPQLVPAARLVVATLAAGWTLRVVCRRLEVKKS
jgi:hypothetical protein